MFTTQHYWQLAETLGTAMGYFDVILATRVKTSRMSELDFINAMGILKEFQTHMLGTICTHAEMDNPRFKRELFTSALEATVKGIYAHTCLDTAVRESDSPVEVS